MLNRLRRILGPRLLDVYKARKQQTALLTKEHALAVSRAMLKRTKYCFLISHGDDGWCTARLVQPIVDEAEEFILWFGTNPLLRKVREIETDPRVTIAVENKRENANLVLYGTARIVRDEAVRRRRWIGSWRMFFPGGPASGAYVVIRFEAERVELLNFTRNVIPEPFGLRPLVLLKQENGWVLAESLKTAS
ncbi:pyridoxamine 5'-phosphate oxidase family protein [Rhodocaloribacter sp.]